MPRWERPFLAIAAAYNAAWAVAVLLAPERLFARPFPYPTLLAAGVLCVGGFYAANLPRRRPALLAAALACKALGPAITVVAIAQGYVEPACWWLSLVNDVIWIPPTVLLLRRRTTW